MSHHILFTARDIGAAQQIEIISKSFIDRGFHVSVIGSGVAYDYFRMKSVNAEMFSFSGGKSYVSYSSPKEEINELFSASYDLLVEKKANAVICGLGTCDYGIDEAVLYWTVKERLNIPSFQFLETWGTFNHLDNGYPDLYFGFDEATMNYACKGSKAPINIVGSPKHECYSKLPLNQWKETFPRQLGIKDDFRIIGYFGQNPDVSGHTYNFVKLLEAVSAYQKEFSCKLLFRAHPGWRDRYHSYWDYIVKMDIDAVDVTEYPSVEALLCICDIVATCYSTVAVDHAFLSSYRQFPIGVALYLLCGKEIKDYLFSEFGYWKNPLLERGIGFCIEDAEELYDKIKTILDSDHLSEEYFMSTKSLQIDSSPCDKIVQIVSAYLSESE